jgi:RimJ/RimL family protein N-acetyltransferase
LTKTIDIDHPLIKIPDLHILSRIHHHARIQPAVHGDWYWDNTKDHPELYKCLTFGPFDSKEKLFGLLFAQRVQRNKGDIVYAAYDKVFDPDPTPAGIVGFLDASPENLSTELGFLIVFPRYQRTHLTSNMVGLLLQYCLELPENGGLGLRRVQWQANAQNEASVRTALRMGFQHEGVKRWDRVIRASAGKPNTMERLPREGDPRRTDFGRHTALLGLCWDEWEDGGREKVRDLMKPR